MIKLYIVRHGETDWNKLGKIQGTTDIPLNDKGRKNARELKKIINDLKIDICLSSPLKRAKETAKILADNKIKIIYDDLLLERHYGNLEGSLINSKLISMQWDYKLNDKDNNIECIRDCLTRALTLINKIKNKYENKTILIVSHGSFIKALHFNLIGYDETTNFLSFSPQNTTIYEYYID